MYGNLQFFSASIISSTKANSSYKIDVAICSNFKSSSSISDNKKLLFSLVFVKVEEIKYLYAVLLSLMC